MQSSEGNQTNLNDEFHEAQLDAESLFKTILDKGEKANERIKSGDLEPATQEVKQQSSEKSGDSKKDREEYENENNSKYEDCDTLKEEQAAVDDPVNLCPEAKKKLNENGNTGSTGYGMSVILGGILIGGFIYFIPAITASSRDHKNKNAIGVLNLFLGWSFIGWVVALVWALTQDE